MSKADRPLRFSWWHRNLKRDNFANFAELDDACYQARKLLRRKTADINDVRLAAGLLNMAVRTLRSWHGARCDRIRELSGGRQ